MTTDLTRLTVEDRERAIFRHLKSLPDPERGSTVREIWETVSESLKDSVTQQAYYKLLDRLVAIGKLDVNESDGTDGGRRYIVAKHLHAENALTLDDIYELLEAMKPSEAIARVLDARDYFEENRDKTLKDAAQALMKEDPLELVEQMVVDKTTALTTDLAILRDTGLTDRARDRAQENRVGAQLRDLQLLIYRYLGLSRAAVDAAPTDTIMRGTHDVTIDRDQLREELRLRVFGDTVIRAVAVPRGGKQPRIVVAGSDGSTHASVMQLSTARTFTDDVNSQVVNFNNSVVYVDMPERDKKDVAFPYYSVPMTRSAIDDRQNRGMVLAPFMFRYLSESEYEHMAKCATDVVQWRADETVFVGTARSLHDGGLLPRPVVHFRDGTVTPQEREYNHYRRKNEYGDMVREGLARTRKILEKIIATQKPPVFAGAVKSTQQRFFSTLLNWYISRGSRKSFGEPLDPNWDATRAAHIADNEAMSILLSTLEDRRKDGIWYATFGVMRPFHTLTEYYASPKTDDHDWVAHFESVRDHEMKSYENGHTTELPYLASVSDVADDNFVYLCSRADYVAFYIGHTGGDPPPIAPRYEFMESLRDKGADAAKKRVDRNIELVVQAIDQSGLSADKEHNFLSQKLLVKIIPHVIYDAHEKCKAVGRMLETELKSVAFAQLQEFKKARGLRLADVDFLPVSIKRFLERAARAIDDEDPEVR